MASVVPFVLCSLSYMQIEPLQRLHSHSESSLHCRRGTLKHDSLLSRQIEPETLQAAGHAPVLIRRQERASVVKGRVHKIHL